MNWIPVLKKIIDGERIEAAEINPILAALADRDQYLYEQLNSYADKSVLMAYDLLVDPDATVTAGAVVYYKPDAGLNPAKVGFDTDLNVSHFTPDKQSFAIGVVKTVNVLTDADKADLYLSGIIEVDVASMLQTGDTFQAGPLYLSKTEAGKLTVSPGGLAIFVGFALDEDRLFLHPNFDSLNQLFYNYKFDLVDRPSGIPVYSSEWTIAGADVNRLGWIPADDSPLVALKPTGAAFYYNIPADEDVLDDVTLSADEISDALSLKKALPPYPHHFVQLFVNGVLQHQKTDDYTTGNYIINNAGLWWMTDAAETQPWAETLADNSIVTFDDSTDVVQLAGHGLANGTPVSFVTSGTLPNNVESNTVYYVINTDTDDFQISTTEGGSAVDIGSGATGTHALSWLVEKGDTADRPRTVLQFVKLNPDFKSSIVSSLTPYTDEVNDTSKVIQLIKADDRVSTGSIGDLLIKFTPTVTTTQESVVTNRAVKTITYNSLTGTFDIEDSEVVTNITAKNGINVEVQSDGGHVLTLSSFSLSGPVEDIEPEDADYLYKGLHSYLRLKNPVSGGKTGLVGKIVLPDGLPADKNLKISLLCYGSATSGNPAKFKFEYSVSKPGLISDAVTKTNGGADISAGTWTANTAAVLTSSYFEIPSTAFSAQSAVNFRLSRVYSADYTGDVNVLAVYWSIE